MDSLIQTIITSDPESKRRKVTVPEDNKTLCITSHLWLWLDEETNPGPRVAAKLTANHLPPIPLNNRTGKWYHMVSGTGLKMDSANRNAIKEAIAILSEPIKTSPSALVMEK